ncbi:tryptophan halogenase family protein [Microbulbifer discodermiae]|uniref:tryptophan halogenase family protein n=1 Tax=Microbulbifer sp. 2201CG32-9 TaxID=3232309 RepID=UPI00345BD036
MDVNQSKVRSIVILGGGTAGWITAAKLARQLSLSNSTNYKVTLVESLDIPIIGVGEGTWPTMRKTLAELGIDEGDFLRECRATFKQGTRFVNWRADASGTDRHYYHLFGSIFDPADFNLAPYWLAGLAGEKAYADAVSAQAHVCELGLAPKQVTTRQYDGLISYAYHLDAGSFSKFLAKHAVERLGVKHCEGNFHGVRWAENGDIAALQLSDGREIEGDLFVDCSGFRSLLLGKACGIGFESINDILLTDSAIAIQAPYSSDDAPIPCFTKSTAQDAGWIWDISLQNRRGTGHVFSSAHVSDDEAEATLRKYLVDTGVVDVRELESRTIRMNIGYRKQFWHNNCLAIGLSAAFVEPLEASAIFLVEAAANMLAEMLPRTRGDMPYVRKVFNQSMSFRWKRTIDFIKMHYVLSERTGKFWQDNRLPETIPASLSDDLAYWRSHGVSKYQFSSTFEPFPQESYQHVLYGMQASGYQVETQRLAFEEEAVRRLNQVSEIKAALANELPDHRTLVEKVIRFGMPKI